MQYNECSNVHSHVDEQYLSLLQDILDNGIYKEDRTGTGTLSVFSRTMRFDISRGKIPLLTTKRVFTKGLIHELLWFLSGDTNVRYLKEHNVNIWDSWVKKGTEVYEDKDLPTKRLVAGELGPVYGKQWRAWEDVRIVDDNGDRDAVEVKMKEDGYTYVGELAKQSIWKREIDQITEIIRQLKEDPDSRRIILNAWNVSQLKEMTLPPCHLMLQLYTEPMSEAELKNQLKEHDIGFSPMELAGVEPGTKSGYEFWRSANERFGLPTRHLSAELRLRSNDVPLGNPFNIAQYAILVHMLAQVVNMNTKEFVCSMGDAHLYLNQVDGVKEQLSRTPLWTVKPKVVLDKTITDIDDFKYENIQIVDYVSHERISFPGAAV